MIALIPDLTEAPQLGKKSRSENEIWTFFEQVIFASRWESV